MVISNIILFCLICSSLTQILCYGKIFDKIRPKKGFLGDLFSCSMCVGFHTGYVIAFLATYSSLLMFNLNLVDYLFLALLSSITSYILDKIVGDEGIRLEYKK